MSSKHLAGSEFKQAQGRGSAKTGVAHWWIQRATAVALIPLTLWFAATLVALVGSGHAAFVAWLRSPLGALLMILLLIVLFYHMALGLRVVIEDYVHAAGTRALIVLAVQLACLLLAVAGVISVLRIALMPLELAHGSAVSISMALHSGHFAHEVFDAI